MGGDTVSDFGDIYMEYFSDVYRYTLSLCRDEAIAEEVTQETFFKAMRYIHRFNGKCKLYVWLCQIAKNTYYSHSRKQKRLALGIDAKCSNSASDIETAYLDKEAAKQLYILLHDLKEPYKEVYSLRVFGELSYAQIGELFGKNDSWARLIFFRAKKRLQEGMK